MREQWVVGSELNIIGSLVEKGQIEHSESTYKECWLFHRFYIKTGVLEWYRRVLELDDFYLLTLFDDCKYQEVLETDRVAEVKVNSKG